MNKQRRTALPLPPSVEIQHAPVSIVKDLLMRHRLEVPTCYLVIVEGTTDVHYLTKAAELAKETFGYDMLNLGLSAPDGSMRITICTPINPNDPDGRRGGLPQIERLAADLRYFTIEYELPSPICFMLDHDHDGIDVDKRLRKQGFNIDRASSQTLNPDFHPFACQKGHGEREAVIEDLLSVRIQKQFFEASPAYCDVSYRNGEVVRYMWRNESKADLCDYVCEHAELQDLTEILRVLVRVRKFWRLDIPLKVERFLEEAKPES